ncbi:MAG: translation elongation factor 4 [Patescibacteria group bacterium]|nr:translation elongation factor 4 [Patescibacteria group bacterium]MDE1946090.1 translation elongation factor 4 [Patescibacteria group bacterium]
MNIRNFSIIAHIDHGKSTLADRMLELTGTIEKRKMMDQVLDSMELERERGITIKMQPVRMEWKSGGETYVMNLIDTPGHIDFSYEVSRALKAVEGSILLVDATQGVQAQTLTTLRMAQESNLVIIPVVSKIDSPLARTKEVKEEISNLLFVDEKDILEVSGKTGEGVAHLLDEIVRRVPAPRSAHGGDEKSFQSLVFDFKYSNTSGVTVFVRVFDGEVKKNTPLAFKVSGRTFSATAVGIFSPLESPRESLSAGEIGYITTGIKESAIASVGDTVAYVHDRREPLPGYASPSPVVWASVYPESQDDFDLLKLALGKLKFSDSSFTYEEETSGTIGRGYRCGFLGMLHLEIIVERLRREFSLELIVTTPSINYDVALKNGKRITVFSPALFPEDHLIEKIYEPWVRVRIITPSDYLGNIMQKLYDHEAVIGDSESFGDNRTSLTLEMPLRELMRNFFNELKSITSGYASISYESLPLREADVVKMDILVADEPVIAFARIVARRRVQEEAEAAVEKLSRILPRQMFSFKIQAKAMGRIIASHAMSGMKKDVTDYLYGGDITRKMKLREKQKKGKKRMKERGVVNISQDVFLDMMKPE